MTKIWEGIKAWFIPGRKPLRWAIVEREKGVPILDRAADDAAIASLKEHPGMKALLNRFRLQREALEARLIKGQHGDIRGVDNLQSAIAWLGFSESQINEAIGRTKSREVTVAPAIETIEFEKARLAIEGLGITSPE